MSTPTQQRPIVGGMPLVRLRAHSHSLHPSLQKLALHILNDPERCALLSIDSLSEEASVSKATIVRLCKHLGYAGFREFRICLIQELEHDKSPKSLDAVLAPHLAGVRFIVHEMRRAAADLADTLDEGAYAQAVERLASARQIVWYGTGLSGHLARLADHKFSVAGFSSRSMLEPTRFLAESDLFCDDDVIVVISHSGKTASVVEPMQRIARGPGYTMAITDFTDTPLTRLCDLSLITADREYRIGPRVFPWRHSQEALVDALLLDAVRIRRPGELAGPWQDAQT